MAHGHVTSIDVARRANVSQSAVSRTFTEGASVSPETRARVLAAARELGYRPNVLARAVISGRSHLIALLVAYLDNHFYPQILELMSRALQARGYQVLLVMTDTGDQDEIVQKMLQYQVDGIVMASASLSSTLAQECASTGTPVVLFNRTIPTLQTSSVTSDNVQGGKSLAEFLTSAGHHRIAFIAGHEDSSTSQDREQGFRSGLRHPLFARAVGGYTTKGAVEAAKTLMDQPTRPDAIFVANDHMAFPVIDLLRRDYQLRIPEDISIVGYDDVPEAAWDGYSLTTVAQPAEQMVNATVRILLDQIESQTVTRQTEILPIQLIIRNSARKPNG